MRNKLLEFACFCGAYVFSLSAIADPPKELTDAVKLHVGIAANKESPQFNSALADLNNDGIEEAIVLITDPRFCGSGGCVFQIYQRSKNVFKLISKGTIAKPPIRVSSSQANGWKDLILSTGAVGNVTLHFSGKKYPSNPSVQPRASEKEINSSIVVISDGH